MTAELKSKKGFLTVTQAAKLLKVSPDTLRNWDSSAKLVAERTAGGSRRYSFSQLEPILKEFKLSQPKRTGLMSISKAAKFLQISPDTLRNWEKKGIITPNRTEGGARRFSRSELKSLAREFNVELPVTKISEIEAKEQLKLPLAPNPYLLPAPQMPASIRHKFKWSRILIPLAIFILFFDLSLLALNPFGPGYQTADKIAQIEAKIDSLQKQIYNLATKVESIQNQTFNDSKQVLGIKSEPETTSKAEIIQKNLDAGTTFVDLIGKSLIDSFGNIYPAPGIQASLGTASNRFYGIYANNFTVPTSGLGSGLVHSDSSGTLSSSNLNLSSEVSGVLSPVNGGTNQSSYTTGDILFASSTDNLSKLPIGTSNQILTISNGLPIWSSISTAICPTCLIADPSSTQIITPTAPTAVALSITQPQLGSVDVFNVTNSTGLTKYLAVDLNGNTLISGKIGLDVPNPTDSFETAGEIRVNNCVKKSDGTAIAGTCSSDSRLKTNIQPLNNVLDKLTQIEPATFQWDTKNHPEFSFGPGTNYGLVAQQVEKVLPELVEPNGEKGYEAIHYERLPIFLLQALKELNQKVNDLAQTSLESSSSSQLAAQNTPNSNLSNPSPSSNPPQLTPAELLIASDSGDLASNLLTQTSPKKLEISEVRITESLKSLGQTTLGQTLIAGDLTIDGTFSITDGSKINSLPTLYIQNNALAEKVDFFNGQVTINKTGELFAKTIKVASFKVIKNTITGNYKIAKDQKSVDVPNEIVTENSRILITPTSENSGVMAVTKKEPGKFFTVSLTENAKDDVSFDWFIINEVEN